MESTRILKGTAISCGTVSGRAHLVQIGPITDEQKEPATAIDPNEEIARIKQAFQLLLVVIEYMESFLKTTLSGKNLDLFAMQKVLLEERAFKNRIIEAIREKQLSAPQAARQVVEEYKKRFNDCAHQPVRERALDLDDLRMGIIDALHRPYIFFKNGKLTKKKKGRHARIAVTRDLTTRFVIEQNLENVKGILAENGGKTSHAAILCRALKIPCVSGLKNILTLVEDGMPVGVDGNAGQASLPLSGAETVIGTQMGGAGKTGAK